MLHLFQGVFVPELEHVKVSVAIKVLSQSSDANSSLDLLEEARVMASVSHPCCIRIVAVCMTERLMLITPLMPLGSLLDYLHHNRSNIGSRVLLTWAQQIAEVSSLDPLLLADWRLVQY